MSGRGSFWRQNGWVFAFSFLVLAFYCHARGNKGQILRDLQLKAEAMEAQRLACLERREDLKLKMASQTDPAWVEMVLMRDLGVVPEGWLKVHFTK